MYSTQLYSLFILPVCADDDVIYANKTKYLKNIFYNTKVTEEPINTAILTLGGRGYLPIYGVVRMCGPNSPLF